MEQNNQVTVWTRFGYADIYLDQFERHTSKEGDEDLSTKTMTIPPLMKMLTKKYKNKI